MLYQTNIHVFKFKKGNVGTPIGTNMKKIYKTKIKKDRESKEE